MYNRYDTQQVMWSLGLVLVAILAGIFLVYHLEQKEFHGYISSFSWRTEIDVLEWRTVNEERWEDDGGAPEHSFDIVINYEYKERKCTGVGSKRKCRSIYDNKHYYKINKWIVIQTLFKQENDHILQYSNPDIVECSPNRANDKWNKFSEYLGCKTTSQYRVYTYFNIIGNDEIIKLQFKCSVDNKFWRDTKIETSVYGWYYKHKNEIDCFSLKF